MEVVKDTGTLCGGRTMLILNRVSQPYQCAKDLFKNPAGRGTCLTASLGHITQTSQLKNLHSVGIQHCIK